MTRLLRSLLLAPIAALLLAPAAVFADDIGNQDLCEGYRRGVVTFAPGTPNPCVDLFEQGQNMVFILAAVGIVGAIAISIWSINTGARKGYGTLASLSTNPLLLRELPARPGFEEAKKERKGKTSVRRKRTGRAQPTAKPAAKTRRRKSA